MNIRDEHDAFQTLINGLQIAEEGAKQLSRFRPDQRDVWLKMAEVYAVARHSVFQLESEAQAKILKS